MLKDITLGQYFPIDSPLHRLDPRVKIIALFGYIAVIFFAKTAVDFAVITAFTLYMIFMSGIRLSVIMKSLKPVAFLVIFTAAINLFLTSGGKTIVRIHNLRITTTGLKAAATMTIRIMLLVSSTSLLTFTTSPILLTDGIEKLLTPFAKIGFPAQELAMMMTIALRFIPTLIDETDKIIMAQKSRGADFESGNIIRRSKALIPILVPLFISSFRRADELATAMECRCYRGGNNRTRLRELKFSKTDYIAGIQLIIFMTVVIVLGVIGI